MKNITSCTLIGGSTIEGSVSPVHMPILRSSRRATVNSCWGVGTNSEKNESINTHTFTGGCSWVPLSICSAGTCY